MFDPLWKNERGAFCKGHRRNKPSVRRDRAYWWLANALGIPKENAHFGMFELSQCQAAERAILELLASRSSAATVEAAGRADELVGQRKGLDRLMNDMDNPGIQHAEPVSPKDAEELPERWDFQS